MPLRSRLIPTLALAAALAGGARSQVTGPPPPAPIQKEFDLGRLTAGDLERRDGAVTEPALFAYLQGLENRLAAAAGVKALKLHVTRASQTYAALLPHGGLAISAALLARLESEAELAGLMAHLNAHTESCVLESSAGSPHWSAGQRESERLATQAALQTLKTAGYDHSAVLDLFSKLAYEHPAWARATVPDDLPSLRASVETEELPPGGYVTDSSEFAKRHARIAAILAHSQPIDHTDASVHVRTSAHLGLD